MSEKRKHKRIIVEGKVDGRVVLASEIEILDLSLGGVRFKCTKRVVTNSLCTVNLKVRDQAIAINGNVVRSAFRGTKKIKEDSAPVYEVAMEFEQLPESKIKILTKIIDRLAQ